MIIMIFLSYFFFGLSFTLGKALITYTGALEIVFIRLFIAGLLFLSFFFIKRKSFVLPKTLTDYNYLLQFILFGIFMNFSLATWAAQYISSVKSSFYFNLTPFITAIIAYFWYGQILSLKKIAGIFIGFIGFIPYLIAATRYESTIHTFKPFVWLPDIAMFFAVTAYAYGWILLNDLEARGYSSEFINGIAMLSGGILSFLAILGFKEFQPISHIGTFIFLMSLLIIAGNIIFYALYSYLLHYYSPTFLSFIGIITPLYAALLGRIFLHEPISLAFFVTIVIVGIGMYIFCHDELSQSQ